jgi:hypothetical protein
MGDKVKRYGYLKWLTERVPFIMEQQPDGMYVDYDDHTREVDAYRETIAKLEERLKEAEIRGCQCSDDDACRFTRERDAARAELKSTQEALLATRAEADGLRACRHRCGGEARDLMSEGCKPCHDALTHREDGQGRKCGECADDDRCKRWSRGPVVDPDDDACRDFFPKSASQQDAAGEREDDDRGSP